MNNSDLWNILPDSLLLYIFSHLSAKDLVNVRNTCKRWFRVAADEFLWKRLFHRDFKIDSQIPIAPGRYSWLQEYKRLKYHTPTEKTETLREHYHQVLHVSFAHNGEMFASSSKDGFIKVWKATHPAVVKYSEDMKRFSWNYTQFSQFNESDTLLLVSGVHFGTHTASGEIAVFNIQENFSLQCRVLNKPYDVFGTWYTDDYLLSGRLHFLERLVSCSALWLNKAWQESESEKKPIVKRLFKFYNRRASSIRTITVANCLMPDPTADATNAASTSSNRHHTVHGNPVSRDALSVRGWPIERGRTMELASGSLPQEIKVHFTAESKAACTMDSPIRYSQDYRKAESADLSSDSSGGEDNTSSDYEDPLLPWDEEWSGLSEDDIHTASTVSSKRKLKRKHKSTEKKSQIAAKLATPAANEEEESADSLEEEASIEKILDPREKFLIFTTGSLTYTPHQIGFKRIKPFKFAERITDTLTLMQRLAERNQESPSSPNWHDEQSMMHYFDKIDHVIDLHGHIIGMGLSPDHRYLYVNSRPWPQNYVVENPLTPPPIAQEIDIHVIDLCTLKEVGTMLRSHKAYTPNDECFFIFLDVSDQYVASGAEDMHGYLWDRHYGNCLSKLPHRDVVNSVAFNPKDPEMLVTASDDHTLKVWRSKNRVRELSGVIDATEDLQMDLMGDLQSDQSEDMCD